MKRAKNNIKWKDSWLDHPDGYKDRIGDWAVYSGVTEFRCIWCRSKFEYCNQGLSAFSTHSKTRKHQRNADGQQGRLENQPTMLSSTAADREFAAENNNEGDVDDPEVPEDETEDNSRMEGREGQVGLGRGRFGIRGSSRAVADARSSARSVHKDGAG